MPVQGLHLITPSAAVATGTGSSATIDTGGSVTFSAATTLELRGVFSADYDNYQIVCRWTQGSGTSAQLTFQLVSGSTPDSSSNYTTQSFQAGGTTATVVRNATTTQYQLASTTYTPLVENYFTLFLYGPNLAQPTASRALFITPVSGISLYNLAGTHNVSTSYDGIKFSEGGASGSGRVSVYGMRK